MVKDEVTGEMVEKIIEVETSIEEEKEIEVELTKEEQEEWIKKEKAKDKKNI
jgi:hypothetical protein